jgi:hypothetical protein
MFLDTALIRTLTFDGVYILKIANENIIAIFTPLRQYNYFPTIDGLAKVNFKTQKVVPKSIKLLDHSNFNFKIATNPPPFSLLSDLQA